MSKNVRKQKKRLFGTASTPQSGSVQRWLHMTHIQICIDRYLNVPNRMTPGRKNANGKHIDKPDWKSGYLEYQSNPDAAIHELGHLYLMPLGMNLSNCQIEMDAQFGHCISQYGFMTQKRTLFEVLPMAMENKIRRRFGLPACSIHIKEDKTRTSVDNGTVIAVKAPRKGATVNLIRQTRLLNKDSLERLRMIDNGELIFDAERGWHLSECINSKINARARSMT